MKKLSVLVLIAMLAACTGVDTLRVRSVPEQAKVYVNGEYTGRTPCTVPADWYKVLVITRGEKVHLVIAKEGYKTVEKTVLFQERTDRKAKGDIVKGSDYGAGVTYVYNFTLEPLHNK